MGGLLFNYPLPGLVVKLIPDCIAGEERGREGEGREGKGLVRPVSSLCLESAVEV